MYETVSANEVLHQLRVEQNVGLSAAEAEDRRAKYGPNKLAEKKKKSVFGIFISQFNDPMIFILLIAAVLSIAISIYSVISPNISAEDKPTIIEIIADPAIILIVCIINAVIGTAQETKAEQSLEELKKMSSPTCVVRRDGEIQEIKVEDLVPGDIVLIEDGGTIPADLRLIETHNLKVDESSLTGESAAVEKDASFVMSIEVGVGDRVNCAFMNTPVIYGRAEGVVIATGMNTETGKIADLLSNDDDQTTPLQKKLADLSRFLGLLTIILVIIIFGVQMLRLFGLNHGNNWAVAMIDDFMFAVSLAVAAVPEGLPAVVTIVLALGVQKMAKANTIVRKLPSVETLGSVSVICSDKTGTLTQNKMTVTCCYVDEVVYEAEALLNPSLHRVSAALSLCSNASVGANVFGDPTEVALVEFANKHGQPKEHLLDLFPRIDELPFDSVRKMMSTKHSDTKGNKVVCYTKGALDSILPRCVKIDISGEVRPINEKDIQHIQEASNAMARDALRVLAVAYKTDGKMNEENMIFLGLVGMIDPPRPECKKAVSILKEAGIITVMITGDQKVTALAIAKELGIANAETLALSGEEIDKLTPSELRQAVKNTRVFARVSPENKVAIVQAFRLNGHIVAMTGDGVNDAPSLKAADIGISMGITGTDVAKGAADMILTDDNFASIEKAVEEGRGIYTNIKKTVLFLLGSNFAEVVTMAIVVVLSLFAGKYNLPTPLISVHVLWVNLITDSLPAVALGADEKEKDIMKLKPRKKKEGLFAKGGIPIMIGYGLLIALITLVAYFAVPIIDGGIEVRSIGYVFNEICRVLNDEPSIKMTAQTCAFCTLGIGELFHMLGMTSTTKSVLHNFRSKSLILWLAFGLGIALQFAVVMIPGINTFFKCNQLDLQHWLMVLVLSIIPVIVHEIVALILLIRRTFKKYH